MNIMYEQLSTTEHNVQSTTKKKKKKQLSNTDHNVQ